MAKLTQGEDKTLTFRLEKKLADGSSEPFDLTGFDIEVCFQNTVEPDLKKAGVIVPPDGAGKFTVTLDDAETTLLKAGDNQDLEVKLDKGTDTTLVQLLRVLDVAPRICP